MSILVTGVAGFIGSSTARALLARGEKVVGIDNLNDYYDPALRRAGPPTGSHATSAIVSVSSGSISQMLARWKISAAPPTSIASFIWAPRQASATASRTPAPT